MPINVFNDQDAIPAINANNFFPATRRQSPDFRTRIISYLYLKKVMIEETKLAL